MKIRYLSGDLEYNFDLLFSDHFLKFKDTILEKEEFKDYKGKIFRIDHILVDEATLVCDHVSIMCVSDPSFIVLEYVHLWDLEKLKNFEESYQNG